MILYVASFQTTRISDLQKKFRGDEAPFLTTTSLPELSANSASKIWVLQTRLQFNRVQRNSTRPIMNAEAQCRDSNQVWGVVAVLRHLGTMSRLSSLCGKQPGRDPFLNSLPKAWLMGVSTGDVAVIGVMAHEQTCLHVSQSTAVLWILQF